MANNPVLIIGTGAEARIVLDIVHSNDSVPYGFVTDDETKLSSSLNDVSVFGKLEDEDVIRILKDDQVDYCVAIGDIKQRKSEYLSIVEEAKRPAMNASHQNVIISNYAKLGFGNILNAGVVLNANCTLGDLNILQTYVSIEADAVIGSFCNIGAGVRIGGNSIIEDEVFIGTGAVIHPGIKIGKGALIAAGAVVIQAVEPGKTVFGNPAQSS